MVFYTNSIDRLNSYFFKTGKFIRVFYTKPLMMFTQHHFFRDYALGTYEPHNLFKNRDCFLFSADNWYWSDNKYRIGQNDLILEGYKKFISNYPKTKVIFMHPDQGSIEGYGGIPYIVFNRNAMIDINEYYVTNNKNYKYDSIYNANFYRYKRHELLKDLNNVGLIYYLRSAKTSIWYISEEEMQYGRNLENKFLQQPKKYHLINRLNGEYKYLSQKEICNYYQQSYCGLCLSDVEGACLTSVEYLLSGLPVVSTKNIGGRDIFLDDFYALSSIEDSSEVVQESVEYFKSNIFSGEVIRETIVNKINSMWNNLPKQLNDLTNNIDYDIMRNNLIHIWKDYKPQ